MSLLPNDALEVLATVIFIVLASILAISDLKTLKLPLSANLSLLVAGFGLGWWAFGVPLFDRAIGAAGGYASIQAVSLAFRVLRGKAGIGGGDPILLAAIGSWVGWSLLPQIVLVASFSGLLFSLILSFKIRNLSELSKEKLPFGTLLIFSTFFLIFIR